MIVDILIAALVLLLLGSLPAWPWSRRWGWYGTGGVGATLLIAAVLLFFNVI